MIVEELAAKFGIEVDSAQFAAVDKAIDGLKNGWLGLAAGFTAALVGVSAAVKATADAGDEAAEAAEKLGITSQALQGLRYAADLSDTSSESLGVALKFLQRNAVEAAKGTGEAFDAFKKAGVKVKDATGNFKSADVLLEEFADKFATLPQGTEKTALAMKVFGKSGAEIIPLLNKGSEKIASFRMEAEALGVVMSDATVQAAGRFDDATKRATAALTGLRNRLTAPLLERFAALIEKIGANFKRLEKPLLGVVNAVGVFVDAIVWLLGNENRIKGLMFAVGTALTTWALAALSAAAGSVALGAASIAAAAASAAAWLAATLPLILIGGLLFLLIDDLYTFAIGGKSAIGEVIKWVDKINPDDNPLVNFLKACLSLVFDLGDPKKWERVSEAMRTALLSGLGFVLQKLGELSGSIGLFLADVIIRALKNVADEIPFFGQLLNEQIQNGISIAKLFGDGAKIANKKGAQLGGKLDTGTGSEIGTLLSSMLESPTDTSGIQNFGQDLLSVLSNPTILEEKVTGKGPQNRFQSPGFKNTTSIYVTVPPGTDANGVAESVRKVVDDTMQNIMRDAGAAVEGG